MRTHRRSRGQIIPIFAIFGTVLVGFAALAIDGSSDRATQIRVQDAAHASAVSAAAKLKLANPTWAVVGAMTPSSADGVASTAQSIAALNGIATLSDATHYCNSSTSIQFNVTFYDTTGSCPRATYNYSLTVQVPPIPTASNPTPPSCSPTYTCVGVSASEKSWQYFAGGAFGSSMATVGASTDGWDGTAPIVTVSQVVTSDTGTEAQTAASCPSGAPIVCWYAGASGNLHITTGNNAAKLIASGTSNKLKGISCASTSQCYAVGLGGTVVSATYSGGTASASTLASSGTTADLAAISCDTTGTGLCLAVDAGGYSLYGSGTGSWTQIVTGTSNALLGVSCVSSTSCLAVGASGTVDYFNGTTWTVKASLGTGNLNAITCVDATHCWVVGDSGLIDFSASISAPSWTSETSNTSANLYGIACTATTTCEFVGANGTIGHSITLGSANTWILDGAGDGHDLYGVACVVGGTLCSGSGDHEDLDEGTLPSPFSSSLGWANFGTVIQGTPSYDVGVTQPFPSQGNQHIDNHAMWVDTASDIWESGLYNCTSGPCNTYSQVLVEHFDGTSWSNSPAVNTSTTQNNDLRDITGTGPNDVWAAGTYCTVSSPSCTGGYYLPLVEHYDGTSWTRSTGVNGINQTSSQQIQAIVEVTSSNLWIFGEDFSGDSGNGANLAIHCTTACTTGSNWTASDLPAGAGLGGTTGTCAGQYSQLYGAVMIPGTSNLYAVGRCNMKEVASCLFGCAYDLQPEGLYYNSGTSTWTADKMVSNSVSYENDVWTVRSDPSGDLWAEGFGKPNTTPLYNNLAMSCANPCNATSTWTLAALPNPGVNKNQLTDVYATAANNVFLIGNVCTNSTGHTCAVAGEVNQTAVYQYNGSTWSTMTTSNYPGTAMDNIPYAVAGINANDIWVSDPWDDQSGGGPTVRQLGFIQYGYSSEISAFTASLNPVTLYQPVTFSVTVSPSSPAPTGNVVFYDNGTPITGCTAQALNGSQQATCSTSWAATGTHSIMALYVGDTHYSSSITGALYETVS